MICIIHGYLLEGSGSNIWTQSILRTICQAGQTIHVMCQEPHPEKFDFIAQAFCYEGNRSPRILFQREVKYPGKCILHKPTLEGILPVYIWSKYEEYDKVIPMVQLDDVAINRYLHLNVEVLQHIVQEYRITSLFANHEVPMSVVAQRVSEASNIPFAILPHGTAIEFAVKKDPRFYSLAEGAFHRAARIFILSPDLRQKVNNTFVDLPELKNKMVDLEIGLDTAQFQPIPKEMRRQRIEKLAEVLAGTERGKSREHTRRMRHRLGDTLQRDDLRKILSQAGDYTGQHSDVDCEAKLQEIDWENEKILIYVGRLTANKGVQNVIAAMPSILQNEPTTRLLVVGFGPLREAIEAWLWALDNGKRTLFQNIIEWGRYLEGARNPESMAHVQHYLKLLEQNGTIEAYFRCAQEIRISERVVFTGYLTHHELRYIFPNCDVAVFPTPVSEAGPLVFLEAMSAGVFPLGIYQESLAAGIDTTAHVLPSEAIDMMKLRVDEEHAVQDIASHALTALKFSHQYSTELHRVAKEFYDWQAVANKFLTTLDSM